jgi:hypothetical protein
MSMQRDLEKGRCVLRNIDFGGISGNAAPASGKVRTKFLRNLSNSEYLRVVKGC